MSQILERRNHEVLAVSSVPRTSGDGPNHTVRMHHTMYAHAALSASAIGPAVTLTLRLHPWDDGAATLTGEDRTFALSVDGEQVGEMATMDGTALQALSFTDPGTYTIAVAHPTAQGASVEVTV